MEHISHVLEKQGCKTLLKEQFAYVGQCKNSFIVKSPSIPFIALFPAPKLQSLRQQVILDDLQPQSIDAGHMLRSGGSWSRMFDFTVNNEITFTLNPSTFMQSKDDAIAPIVERMNDQAHYFNEDLQTFNVREDFQINVEKLKKLSEEKITRDLKIKHKSPIACHAESLIHMPWSFDTAENLDYKVQVHCVVPNIKKQIENTIDSVDSNLERGQANRSDIRFINSRVDKDHDFLLTGIHLHQKGTTVPMLAFTIMDEKIIEKPNFMKKIDVMQSSFSEKSDNVKPIDLSVFTRYLVS